MAVAIEDRIRGKTWVLQRPNHEIRSPFITLDDGGQIYGYVHPNEASWAIVGDKLVFKNFNGHISAISGKIEQANNSLRIEMMRGDDHNVTAHFLVERQGPLVDFSTCSTLNDILALLPKHRAFKGDCCLGQPGFSAPSIKSLAIIEVTEANLNALKEIGINIAGGFGKNNFFIIDSNMSKLNITVHINGKSNNTLMLDPQCRLRGSFIFEGDENIVIAGAASPGRDVSVSSTFRYNAAGLFLGMGGSCANMNIWLEGPGCSVQIGDDYMFSWGIWLRTADSHAIINLDTGQPINLPRSIKIEDHVWLGQDVIAMSGVTIGSGSVVGARSVVTKDVPPACVAVGIPARAVRQRTSWTRTAHPSSEQIKALQQAFEKGNQ